jgi:hypothetical protein
MHLNSSRSNRSSVTLYLFIPDPSCFKKQQKKSYYINLRHVNHDVTLGSVNSLASIPFDEPYWLGIAVNGGNELSRIEFTSAAYSLNAGAVDDNAISSEHIQDGSISLADIGQNGAQDNQVIKWNGHNWAPAEDQSDSGGVTDHGALARIIHK